MTKEDILFQLNDLKKYAKKQLKYDLNDGLSPWAQDILALNEAIKAVNETVNLKQRAQEAEMLLREIQPYCIPEDSQKISEFFKR